MVTDLFLSVLGISASVSLIVGILLLLSPLLNKRYAAKWKYWIWIILALRLLFPYGGSSVRTAVGLVQQTENQNFLNAIEGDLKYPSGQAGTLRRIIVQIPEPLTRPIAAQEEANDSVTLLDIIAWIWITVSLLFLGFHLISYFRYSWQVRRSGKQIKDVHRMRQVFELKRELHIGATVQVVVFSEASGPMMTGFFHPVLILPEEYYDEEKLFYILKHELIHWKRKDVYGKLLLAAANAVHWFNPLIWIMHKEAVVDMELSCDERVTQGTGYAERKAYTEALLFTIHQQCAKKNMLSTQFYGGKQIMKKRFQNILSRTGKKSGAAILVCAVILTASLGTMIGCSAVKENSEELSGQAVNNGPETDAIGNDGQGTEADTIGNDGQDTGADTAESGGQGTAAGMTGSEQNGAPDRMTLTIMKEGEPEEKQAVLAVEDGYSLYLPEGEWQKNEEGIWQAVVNEDVCIWVERYDREHLDEQLLSSWKLEAAEYMLEGSELSYTELDDVEFLVKTDGESDIICKVKLFEDGEDVWCVFCSYPEEAEEGWGSELRVIADTFAITAAE